MTLLHAVNDFYGLVLPPLLPALRDAFSLSYTQIGVIPFLSTAVSSVLQPSIGYFADLRLLRRVAVACGFVGFAIGMLLLSAATSYGLILAAAVVLGLAASTYHPQSATLLLATFQQNRGFAQGVHGLGNSIGFLIAPIAVAWLVQEIGWSAATRYLAIPALVAAAAVMLTVREPVIRGSRGLFAGVTRPLALLTVINGLALATNLGFLTWLPSYYSARGYSLAEAGILTAIMALAGLIAQPAGGALSDRFGRRRIVFGSLVGMGVFQIVFLISGLLPAMLFFSLAAGFCASLMAPVVMVYASELAPGHRTGTAVGIVWGFGTTIAAFAPLLVGIGIDRFGFVVAYVAVSCSAFLAAILAYRLPR